MDSSNAEKAWEDWVLQNPDKFNLDRLSFMAGRASRDAEVAELTAKLAEQTDLAADYRKLWLMECDRCEAVAAERDAALKALAESRARYGELELQLVEAQAVIEKVRAEIHHAEDNGHHLSADCQGIAPGEHVPAVRVAHLDAALSVSPSVVLEDRDREIAARALEAFAEFVYADRSYGWGGLMRTNVMTRARNRAAAIRKGDTNA